MKRFLFLLIVVMLGFSACKVEEEPQRVINIAKEFNIEMIEVLSPDQNRLAFNISTIENQDCINTTINYTSVARTNYFKVILKNIEEPDNCLPGDQIVSSIIPFDHSDNDVSVEIQLSDVVNNIGKIKSNSDNNQYSFTMETEHGFRISNATLNTIPKGYFWGYIGTNNGQIVNAMDAFSLDMESQGEDALFNEGNYGHFTIASSGINDVKDKENLQHELLFLKKLTGSKDEIKQLAQEFRIQYGTDLILKVYTSEGEVY